MSQNKKTDRQSRAEMNNYEPVFVSSSEDKKRFREQAQISLMAIHALLEAIPAQAVFEYHGGDLACYVSTIEQLVCELREQLIEAQ